MLMKLKLLGLLMTTLLVLAACGGAPAPATAPTAAPAAAPTTAPATVPTTASAPAAGDDLQVDKAKLSKKLSFYTWADYISPEVIKGFQTEYGVEISVDVYDNNEDMIAKVRTGSSGYDVVVPSDYAIDLMAKDSLIAKLDKTLLPNMKHLKPENIGLYYDKDNTYSLPYNEGLTGIAYLKDKFPTALDSWSVFFDPAQAEKIKGQFTMLDDEREVPGAALRFIGKSLNDTDPADLKQVEGILKAQKPFVSAYDSSSVARKLSSGEIIVAHCYSNVALQARLGLSSGDQQYPGNPQVGFFMPKEGGTIWQDNLAIVADSPNQYTAHVFLNYLMRPDVAAKNTIFNLGITPNKDAEALLPENIKQLFTEGFAPDANVLKRTEWIVRNDKTSVFTDLWTAVRGQ
jgi:spermidine/putrescine transport system substrate-binding protein